MRFRQWRQFRWKFLLVFAISAGALASFQNCGKTGASAFGSTTSGAKAYLASQPAPVETTLNQISYMSCPKAGNTTVNMADPLANPFYHLRFGAFDNSVANGFTAFAGTNVGGIGFSKSAMAYMRGVGGTPNAGMLTTYINSSPYTANGQPVVALINQYRSPSSLAWTALATTLLAPFSNATFVSALSSQPQLSGAGTQPTGYFSNLPSGANSLLGSLVYGKTAVDEANFRANLTNEYLFAGLAPASVIDPATIIKSLQSPDNDPTKRLFGNGYSFAFVANQSYLIPSSPGGPSGVNEWALNPDTGTTPINLTTQNSQQWDCFPLTVVRDVDRKYWTVAINNGPAATMSVQSILKNTTINMSNNQVVYPKDVPAALSQYGLAPPMATTQYGLVVNYFRNPADITSVMNALAAEYTANVMANLLLGYGSNGGTFYACPPEDPTSMSEGNLERLRVVRRFLPADQWEVNISAGCVVPTAAALNIGACYDSGDTNQAMYIQYNGTNGTSCGTNMNECPARASFCWRYQ